MLESLQDGRLMTNNPCPICRDEYFVVDYRNLKLISQFMEDYTGRILDAKGTGVCQLQWVQGRAGKFKNDFSHLGVSLQMFCQLVG